MQALNTLGLVEVHFRSRHERGHEALLASWLTAQLNELVMRLGVLAITHYNRLLAELLPDQVHILVKGRIVASGGPELADQVERDGYEAFADASLAK